MPANKKPRQLDDREQLARDIFLGQLAIGTKTAEHSAVLSLDLADTFFDELESRRKPAPQEG